MSAAPSSIELGVQQEMDALLAKLQPQTQDTASSVTYLRRSDDQLLTVGFSSVGLSTLSFEHLKHGWWLSQRVTREVDGRFRLDTFQAGIAKDVLDQGLSLFARLQSRTRLKFLEAGVRKMTGPFEFEARLPILMAGDTVQLSPDDNILTACYRTHVQLPSSVLPSPVNMAVGTTAGLGPSSPCLRPFLVAAAGPLGLLCQWDNTIAVHWDVMPGRLAVGGGLVNNNPTANVKLHSKDGYYTLQGFINGGQQQASLSFPAFEDSRATLVVQKSAGANVTFGFHVYIEDASPTVISVPSRTR